MVLHGVRSFTKPGRRARQHEIERERHYPPLMFEVDPHQFSWLREVVVPAIFVALGAVLGAALAIHATLYYLKCNGGLVITRPHEM